LAAKRFPGSLEAGIHPDKGGPYSLAGQGYPIFLHMRGNLGSLYEALAEQLL